MPQSGVEAFTRFSRAVCRLMVPVLSVWETALVALAMLAFVLFAARIVQPGWWTSPAFRTFVLIV